MKSMKTPKKRLRKKVNSGFFNKFISNNEQRILTLPTTSCKRQRKRKSKLSFKKNFKLKPPVKIHQIPEILQKVLKVFEKIFKQLNDDSKIIVLSLKCYI